MLHPRFELHMCVVSVCKTELDAVIFLTMINGPIRR